MEDIDQYDKKCKVEPLMRALKEADSGAWINGRRRDHGFERAALPLWEGTKVGGWGCILQRLCERNRNDVCYRGRRLSQQVLWV